MKIRAIFILCLSCVFTLGNAQNQDIAPDKRKSAESQFKSVCATVMDEFPIWKNMKASEVAAICGCAIPLTLDSMASNRTKDADLIYRLLTQNYFKCGEVKLKQHWAAHLKRENNKITQSQAICIADQQYQFILDSFGNRENLNREEVVRRTEICY